MTENGLARKHGLRCKIRAIFRNTSSNYEDQSRKPICSRMAFFITRKVTKYTRLADMAQVESYLCKAKHKRMRSDGGGFGGPARCGVGCSPDGVGGHPCL
jgi:hypothetical protein